MAYEYFLQAHLHKDIQEIPTEKILFVFQNYILEKSSEYIELKFDENNFCTIYLNVDEACNSGLMISRPCGGKLGECLYEVMQLGNFVFFEPDGKYMIAVNTATEDHLPMDMIESLGEPVVAKDVEDFLEIYYNNR